MQKLWLLALSLSLFALLGFSIANFYTSGNVYLVGKRAFTNPIKLYMGPDENNGLYFAVQERADGSLFTVIESFKRPDKGVPVAEGYGYYPLRLWGKHWMLREDGVGILAGVVTEKLTLQRPDYTKFGGVTLGKDLSSYITMDGDCMIFYVKGEEEWRICPRSTR